MSSPEKEGFLPVQPEALQLGMYIWLDCPWYKHPFARNQFKLSSGKDLAQIKQLGPTRIYFDPRRSDPQASRDEEATAAPEGSAQRQEPRDSVPQAPVDINLSGSDTQEVLKAANRAYGEVVQQTKEVLYLVKAGQKEGLEAAQTLVGNLVHQMVDEDMSVGLASLVNFKKLDRLQVLDTLNVCILSVLVGRELELGREALRVLGLGALLHDIGQDRLPTQVLYKIGALTKAERALFQLHPRFGKEMALQIPGFPQQSIEIIYQHHEHLDGSGFPEGLRGSRISFLAQIVRVVDVYGYLISPRDSERRMTPAEALADLYVNRKRQFAKEIVTALIRVLSVYPPGTFVELSDGSIGIVISSNLQDRMRPWVALLESGKGPDRPEVRNLVADQSLSIVRNVHLSEFPPDIIERVDLGQLLGYLLIQPGMSKAAGQNDRKAASPTMVP
jgi:HD-GYP domain-containing protein (c-di-GMP phosphodiesterase class II)